MAELEPRNFLQPCLLLLLREQPDHGYELAARLRPMHDGEGDAGGVYRALRSLERQGLVCSEWQTSDVGPARRTYHITPEGNVTLEDQAHGLERIHDVLHVFLERYSRVADVNRPPAYEGLIDDHRAAGLDVADHRARDGGVRAAHRTDSGVGR
jgi:poly-beta-hydroxybutyrate-responsive repressor